jgi:multicomponent Na+:H+ antiporter subunit G
MIDLVVEGFTVSLAWLGAAFVMLAALGVLRMPDIFTRLHASSKAATLGAAFVALAVAVHFRSPEVAIRSFVLIGFLFMTAPISAHLLVRAGYLTGVPLSEETVLDEAREHFEHEHEVVEARRRETLPPEF